jgi:O-antigen ligase
MAGAALGQPLSPSVTLDRFETMRGLVSLASYAGVFLLAIYAVADLRVARMLVRLFIYAAAGYAVYGLVVYFTGSAVVLWFEKEQYRNVVTGTFDNRNNFAAYCGMALIAAVGLFLNEVSRRRQMPTKQAAIVIADRIWRMTWPLVVSAGILGTALLLTTSRGGAISTLVGLVGLCGVIFLTPRIRPLRLRGLLAVGLLIVGSLVVLSGDQTTQRIFTSLEGEEERFPVFIATVQAIRDFTVSGTGLGSFEDAFRLYRSADINGRFSLAHNDYLEAAMELGLPAAGAMLLAVLWLLGMAWRELRARRRGAIVPCIAVAVSLQLGFHSLLDFSMQVPAVVITYVTLLACALARADRDISADRPDDKRMGGRRPGKTKRSA